ncbi:MAG: DNA alkylation repair protein [bacterium]|nr:DNA alkylation repair protein [bacterium]
MEKIISDLFEMQDIKYRDFHSRLIPNIDKERIIGVRMPDLRRYAKKIAKEPYVRGFLDELPHYYYEENNLHAALIAGMKGSFEELMTEIERFLPYIDNWATCDMFSPKLFKKYPNEVYEKCMEWIKSDKTYTIRFGIDILMSFYLDESFRAEIIDTIAGIRSEEYYVNMAAAWFYSYALIKQYESTIGLFREKRLDKWVHNKSIQKAVESRRIDEETKAYLKTLKIK